MKKTLITGTNGFIGSYFVENLYKDKKLICIDEDYMSGKLPDYKRLENEFKQNEIETILHFGAISDTNFKGSVRLFDEYNVNYTAKLLELFRTYNVKRFVFASSASVYGNDNIFNENYHASIENLNYYAQSKLQCERILMNAVSSLDSDQKIQIFRLFNVFGDDKLERMKILNGTSSPHAKFEYDFKRKGYVEIFDGIDAKRDFIHVSKVYTYIDFFVEYEQKSGIWNIGSGYAESFESVAIKVLSKLQVSNPLDYIKRITPPRFDRYQYYTCANLNKIDESIFNNHLREYND